MCPSLARWWQRLARRPQSQRARRCLICCGYHGKGSTENLPQRRCIMHFHCAAFGIPGTKGGERKRRKDTSCGIREDTITTETGLLLTDACCRKKGRGRRIYTDWANHYLAKSGCQRLIKDLSQDVTDGVLLAQIIQIIANEKVEDINGSPRSQSQMNSGDALINTY
ncbi:hypothetical protein FQN60_005455 [Etheostoma spectabile]|uniref:Calponin-homology (CH) domain-containing protein n=1 Tax=Etheostoma spectabile TaxID=54343 RepID=A0A5J5CIA4_9PERO|nr:hypothetical protein FQN60_005455 [Etheostoma spectabile]